MPEVRTNCWRGMFLIFPAANALFTVQFFLQAVHVTRGTNWNAEDAYVRNYWAFYPDMGWCGALLRTHPYMRLWMTASAIPQVKSGCVEGQGAFGTVVMRFMGHRGAPVPMSDQDVVFLSDMQL